MEEAVVVSAPMGSAPLAPIQQNVEMQNMDMPRNPPSFLPPIENSRQISHNVDDENDAPSVIRPDQQL